VPHQSPMYALDADFHKLAILSVVRLLRRSYHEAKDEASHGTDDSSSEVDNALRIGALMVLRKVRVQHHTHE
jgi:hypothetical protein